MISSIETERNKLLNDLKRAFREVDSIVAATERNYQESASGNSNSNSNSNSQHTTNANRHDQVAMLTDRARQAVVHTGEVLGRTVSHYPLASIAMVGVGAALLGALAYRK
jgi:hypothetical protein